MLPTTPQGAIAHRLLRRKQVEQAIGLSRSATLHHDFVMQIQIIANVAKPHINLKTAVEAT